MKPPSKKSEPAKPAPKKAAAPAKPEPKHASKHDAKPASKPAPKAEPPRHEPKHESKPAPAPVKPAAAKAAAAPAKPAGSVSPAKAEAGSKRADLRSRILEKSRAKAAAKPIAFSLDEVRELAKAAQPTEAEIKSAAKGPSSKSKALELAQAKPAQPHHVKAASLADILGFNPRKAAPPADEDDASIPEKFRRYYKLLIELRRHLTGQLDTHTEETLKRSAKDDAGDLSSYGQHMADAGTDTFDRDFALSLVSSEQEALSEVEAAIKRVKDGTYGLCEATGKPIPKERLIAVPFTRYSAEALKEIERNRMRTRTQAGLFGEIGEEGGKMMDEGGDDD